MAYEYHLMAVNDEAIEYGQQAGVALPDSVPPGRLPTLEELYNVARAISGHHIADQNQAQGEFTLASDTRAPMEPTPPFKQSTAPSSFLQVSARSMGAAGTYGVFFHGDAELMVKILRALSEQCGSLMFFEQSDALPWFVLPKCDHPIGPVEWRVGEGV